MQLGTRWPVGAPAPGRLPTPVLEAVARVEDDVAGHDTSGWHWTLTWLEGRPVVTLDDGTVVTLDADTGTAVVREAEEEADRSDG